jgi:hypothetical protein
MFMSMFFIQRHICIPSSDRRVSGTVDYQQTMLLASTCGEQILKRTCMAIIAPVLAGSGLL